MQQTDITVRLKYRLAILLMKMPGVYRDNRYKLCIHCGISERTLTNWLKIDATSSSCIPSDTLFLLADFFNCTPNDLLNK